MKNFTIAFGIALVVIVLGWFATRAPRIAKAQNYLNQGDGLFDQSKFNEAIIQYSKAIILRPTWAQPHLQKAKAYFYLKYFDKAKMEYQKARAEDNENLEAYLGFAQIYLVELKPEQAKKILEQAAALHPNSAKIYLFFAKTELFGESPQKASEDIKKALRGFENNGLIKYYDSIIAFWNQNTPDINNLQVQPKVNRISQQPIYKDWVSERDINNLKIIAKKSKEASSSLYKKVLLGEALNQADEPYLGQILLKEVVREDKEYRDGWVFLGHSYILVSNYEEAEKALKIAQDLDPINSLTFRYLGQVYQTEGNTKKAKESYDKADQLEKND